MPDYYTAMLKQECEAVVRALATGDDAVAGCVLERLRHALADVLRIRGALAPERARC